MYDLNNRQLATAVWALLVTTFILATNQQARLSIWETIRFLFSKQTVLLLAPLLAYTCAMSTLISYAGFALNLLAMPPVFSTLTWVLSTGMTIFDRLEEYSHTSSTYVKRFYSLVAPPALLSISINLVSFPLWAELALAPILFVSSIFISWKSFQAQKGLGTAILISILLMSSIKLFLDAISGRLPWATVVSPFMFSGAMGFAYLVYVAIVLWIDRRRFLDGGQSQLIICENVEFDWPLTTPVAKVFCNKHAVWLMARGVLYPVNGTASGFFRLHGIDSSELESIWKVDPQFYDSGRVSKNEDVVLRVSIGPIIALGLSLDCKPNHFK